MPIPATSGSLGRSLLRDDVYTRLRDAIVDGTFAPGENLKDGDLAEWLGVSRTPVREALLRLAESGLIVARPGRSTAVAELEEDAVRDARDVVAAMHALAARTAVPALSEEHLDRMRDANARFRAALAAEDAVAAVAADDDFHDVLVRASGNDALVAVLDRYSPVLRRAEVLRFVSLDRFTSLERHEQLIAVCAARDADAASALVFRTWHSLPVPGGGSGG
ncbi:GntR family transcriptional regulator [Microbacterium saccharophilum]|uniref:GntR family transcriptional regulator n=1 Tax=Microbacterium saccharophilum TaxID=1213358 RepID=A0A5C8I8N3_9MICO|nr:GntR family transcriptional regulator [Microbacterium saccharophilum]TXK14195.1 GntR family transcriptional regulator [Microbacterium saccharophilum]GEP46754.1 GntR family transcriptional regulator [Microbacterium saccharophilum]